MDYINDAAGSYTAIHDFFQNNGVGDYKVQCSYGGVPYATDEYVHSGDKFWSNNFIDSHFGREIKMYPQSELLAKEYAGNTLPVSISLDKDLIKMKECQKKTKFVELERESGFLRSLILVTSLFGPGVRAISYWVEGEIPRSSHAPTSTWSRWNTALQ